MFNVRNRTVTRHALPSYLRRNQGDMSLELLPDELLEVIVQDCYEEKLAHRTDLRDRNDPALTSYNHFVPFAIRTAVWSLSLTSSRIRRICIPVLFQKLLVLPGAAAAIISGLMTTFGQHIHLVKYFHSLSLSPSLAF